MRRQQRAAPFAPPPSAASFRDVLRFEQRLVQNAERLSKQRRKYEIFLAGLSLSIVSETYYVFLSPSIYSLVRYLHMGLLLILVTALILFFATGIYSEKIARAYKFVPQANRSLRPYNLYLNTRRPRPWYYFGIFGRNSGPRQALSATSTSASSPNSRSPPTSPDRRGTIPLEPSTDPSGELIFSTRVDPAFRDGYRAFRDEWKRQKKERKQQSGPPAIDRGGATKEAMSSVPASPSRSMEGATRTKSRSSTPTSSRGKSRSPSPLSVPRKIRSDASSPSTTDEESGPPSPASHDIDLVSSEKPVEPPHVRSDSFSAL